MLYHNKATFTATSDQIQILLKHFTFSSPTFLSLSAAYLSILFHTLYSVSLPFPSLFHSYSTLKYTCAIQAALVLLSLLHIRSTSLLNASAKNPIMTASTGRKTGRVKFFNSQKGYGFIIPNDFEENKLEGKRAYEGETWSRNSVSRYNFIWEIFY